MHRSGTWCSLTVSVRIPRRGQSFGYFNEYPSGGKNAASQQLRDGPRSGMGSIVIVQQSQEMEGVRDYKIYFLGAQWM